MIKTDVCVIYYGKPYQTIISILTLLKFSRQHINKIYITVEKRQPYDKFGDVYHVIKEISPLIEIDLYYPKYFYQLGGLDYNRTKVDAVYRYQIPYQYALENATSDYLFIMHNDMVFHKDMIGDMLPVITADEQMAGTGSIGQCWSCPGFSAKVCHGSKFQYFVPTQAEALALHETYNTPRKEKDIEVINTGRFYPMPECRLNEYACMIKLDTYRRVTLPKGDNVCFGGNWGFTADLGTGWFYQMVNQGFKFQHFVLEDYASHSQFNPIGQGIHAYSKEDNYNLSEANALAYLKENFNTDASLDAHYQKLAKNRILKGKIGKKVDLYEHKVRKAFRMLLGKGA
ncbi:hypothetical protein [Dyadobacter luticola]|uniref:Uncharacterized protein n=1 Tax=Dyadobacter luticola TaxID=1979387 RepID=A0A5R9L5F3_9BACT|nr:hypothetical protein [Dyadobacter luticola]TLV03796.1 hypothetical protein FEN17_09440 [Dyadobacter luticola]